MTEQNRKKNTRKVSSPVGGNGWGHYAGWSEKGGGTLVDMQVDLRVVEWAGGEVEWGKG